MKKKRGRSEGGESSTKGGSVIAWVAPTGKNW